MTSTNMVTEKVSIIPVENREEMMRLAQGKNHIINLSMGNPDLPTPNYIIKKTKEALEEDFTKYTNYYGIEELRSKIAEDLYKKIKLTYNYEKDIIITHGVQEAIFIAVQSLIDQNDEIIIPTPHFFPFEQAVRFAGGNPVFVELKYKNGYNLDPEALEKVITVKTKAIIFSNPSNPLGVVWTKEQLRYIAGVAKKHNLIVISDEIYDGLIDGVYPGSIAEIDGMQERTLVLNGFSKTYCIPGMRVGYIAGHESIISQIRKLHYCITLCPCSLSQKAALAALNCPVNEKNWIREVFNKRRRILLNNLANIPHVSCSHARGGLFIFPDFSYYETDSLKLSKYLIEEAEVVTLPINVPEGGKGHLRLSLCVSEDKLIEATERMKIALSRLKV